MNRKKKRQGRAGNKTRGRKGSKPKGKGQRAGVWISASTSHSVGLRTDNQNYSPVVYR